MADTSLIFNIIARDKTTITMEKIKASAGSTGALVGKVLGPSLVPVLGVGTGAVLALGASFAAAGAGAGVFGGVLKSTLSELITTSGQYATLKDKIKLYGQEAAILRSKGQDDSKVMKKQAAAMLELQARLKMLPPAQRKATEGILELKEGWGDFVDQNKPATYTIIADGLYLAGQAINKLQPFFDAGAAAAGRLVDSIRPLIMGNGLETLGKRAGPALATLTNIIINVATAVGRTFGAFASDGQGILQWIEGATKKWADFSNVKTGGGLQKFVDYFHQQGPGVVQLLTNLANAAMKIAQAVGPLAPISFAIATALTALIAAMPPNVITALVAAWIAYSIAIKAYGVASVIMTAIQWAQNSAFLASPITWIVLLLLGLVAVIVWAATKTQFFQTVWSGVWGFMKGVGAWFAGPFAGFFVSAYNRFIAGAMQAWHGIVAAWNGVKSATNSVKTALTTAANWVSDKWNAMIGKVISGKNKLVSGLRNMWNGMKDGFRSAINYVIGRWNSLRFTIPSFSILGHSFGGGSIGVPSIPYMATGGKIRSDGLIFAHAGEEITNRKGAQVTRTGGSRPSGGGGATITINGSQSKVVRVLMELLREGIRDQGGDPVKVLTAP